MFMTASEQQITEEYLRQGYVIRPAADPDALIWIRNQVLHLIKEESGYKIDGEHKEILNQIHKIVGVENLNSFRLKVIRGLNSIEQFREMYFRVARPYLEALVGNELAMQMRINLSIQLPNDDSSLLSVHADTWSGDSPFEVVAWLPLVDCYGSKAMYILPPDSTVELSRNFKQLAGHTSENLYQSIKHQVKWLQVDYGDVLIFNQALPHGNRVNMELETRWSMNCRFKGVYTPYGDKKLGEFFSPITLRAATINGMHYELPKT
jgi:sporadic carbohydrate cluster 2OG-Fe(II) oxygenase